MASSMRRSAAASSAICSSCGDCRQALEELADNSRGACRAAACRRPADAATGPRSCRGWTDAVQLERAHGERSPDGPLPFGQVSRRVARRAVDRLPRDGGAPGARDVRRRLRRPVDIAPGSPCSRRVAAMVRRPRRRAAGGDRALRAIGHAPSPEAAFAALSEQHFERSKLVVLGLANKDPQHAREARLGVRARARLRPPERHAPLSSGRGGSAA